MGACETRRASASVRVLCVVAGGAVAAWVGRAFVDLSVTTGARHSRRTDALPQVGRVHACGTRFTRRRRTLVNVTCTQWTREPDRAHARVPIDRI